jgi:hypothetical protein
MKTKFTLLIFVLCVNLQFAQTNNEIANVYLNRAEVKYIEKDVSGALVLFDKAMKYIQEISESRVARIGMLLHYDIKDYQKAKIFSKQYFDLELNKTSDDYINMLEIYVNIDEALEAQRLNDLRIKQERLAQERKKQLIDSLKILWHKKSEALAFNADQIRPFNLNGVAEYSKDGKIGLLSDAGKTLFPHKGYEASLGNDTFKLLLNTAKEPTKIVAYNTKSKEHYELPNVVSFNLSSSHYGTLVDTNTHLLVFYPDNSKDVIVYDLAGKTALKEKISLERLKELKKMDAIDKYDDDEFTVKINGDWYAIASHLGGGIYPLFTEDKTLHGYLLAANGTLLPQVNYNYVGYFSNGRALVQNANEQFWIDQNGVKYELPNDLVEDYQGSTTINKLEEGKYQLLKHNYGKKVIVLDGVELPILEDFIMMEATAKR